jgi:rhomboid protease GluP
MTSSMEGPGTAVRVTESRQRADEWAVVLAAAGIPHWQRRRLDGWALIVPPDDAPTALAALAAYDQETAREAADRAAAAAPTTLIGVVVALLLIGFFAVTGPRGLRSAWFERGAADASRILAGEWWRTFTALTLHADGAHLAGNALAGALLVTVVCRTVGPGVGLSLLLLAGAGGNALTAVVHRAGHVSVGASTALFAALGILAVLRVVSPERVGARGRKTWVVAAASVLLLVLFSAGPQVDLLAHVFGLLAGGALAPLAALTLRWRLTAPVQWLLVAAPAATLVLAWRLAV